jgi:hypothetical protein
MADPMEELKFVLDGDKEYFSGLFTRLERDRFVLKKFGVDRGINTVDQQLLMFIAGQQIEIQHLLTQISYQMGYISYQLKEDVTVIMEDQAKMIQDLNDVMSDFINTQS